MLITCASAAAIVNQQTQKYSTNNAGNGNGDRHLAKRGLFNVGEQLNDGWVGLPFLASSGSSASASSASSASPSFDPLSSYAPYNHYDDYNIQYDFQEPLYPIHDHPPIGEPVDFLQNDFTNHDEQFLDNHLPILNDIPFEEIINDLQAKSYTTLHKENIPPFTDYTNFGGDLSHFGRNAGILDISFDSFGHELGLFYADHTSYLDH